MTRFEKEDSPRFDKARRRSRYGLPRWLPLLLLLLIAIVGFWLIGLEEEGLRQKFQAHHGHLLAFVREKPLWAAGGYLAAYAIAVAFSLPLASLMTLMGGYLFGTFAGTLLAVCAATSGATGLFLIARSSLANSFQARAGSHLARLQTGFGRGAFNYLLALRLIPLFPFWLVNLAPALLGMRLRSYIAATFLGILPSSLIYASIGSRLGSLLEAEEVLGPSILLDPAILLPLLGLALLALSPQLFRAWKSLKK